MFTLNPLNNPDAFWQHAIMIIVAAILGYVIGYIGMKQTEAKLETQLDDLTGELDKCLSEKASATRQTHLAAPSLITQVKKDNLKIIEGIGPKIEELLNSKGIYTYAQLSSVQSEKLTEILLGSGVNFQMHNPRSWPQQAQLAHNQMWDQLKELQDELNKGRFE
jgi:predicted flap endonuclease-1-like 5' DNA nuclease